MSDLLKRKLTPGEFVQIATLKGSSYGELVEIDLPWAVVRDTDGQQVISSLDPALILHIYIGDDARENYKVAQQHNDSMESIMGMMERGMSGAMSQ